MRSENEIKTLIASLWGAARDRKEAGEVAAEYAGFEVFAAQGHALAWALGREPCNKAEEAFWACAQRCLEESGKTKGSLK